MNFKNRYMKKGMNNEELWTYIENLEKEKKDKEKKPPTIKPDMDDSDNWFKIEAKIDARNEKKITY